MLTSGQLKPRLKKLSRAYLFGCGTFFVLYAIFFVFAVWLAANREQVLAVTLINYLWPILTLLLSIPLLRNRAHWLLLPGILLGLWGTLLALTYQTENTGDALFSALKTGWIPCLLSLANAIFWAFYSIFARKWTTKNQAGTVSLFMLAAGLLLGAVRFFVPEPSHFCPRSLMELLVMILFSAISYTCWELAMRQGNMPLVVTMSYFIPLFSVAFTCYYLSVTAGSVIWLSGVLVTAGALLCRRAITAPDAPKPLANE